MTASQIQELIFNETGIKTSVKKKSGSMKHHICFSVMFQNGEYPKFPFEWRLNFTKQFKTISDLGNYSNEYSIDILKINIEEGEPIIYKKERKPKSTDEMKVKDGGSKNSQLRLDKASARYAKALRRGEDRARYY